MADCVKVICHSNFRVNSILNLFSFLNMNETCYVRIAKGSVSHCEASREIRNMSNSYIYIRIGDILIIQNPPLDYNFIGLLH